jgi:hypothetical protein
MVLAWGDVPSKVSAKLHNHESIMIHDLMIKHGLANKSYVLEYKEYEQILTNKKRLRHPSRNTPKSFVKIENIIVK